MDSPVPKPSWKQESGSGTLLHQQWRGEETGRGARQVASTASDAQGAGSNPRCRRFRCGHSRFTMTSVSSQYEIQLKKLEILPTPLTPKERALIKKT